ncbi:MAG: hypothetical protein JWM86_779 [Thermoleophilia bacterium]|nr:hypothetical protein [Thermoleophilia bacterium]
MTGVGRAALITAGAAAGTIVVDRALKVAAEHALDEGERARGPLGTRLVRRTNEAGIASASNSDGLGRAMIGVGGLLALGIAGAGIATRRPLAVQLGAGLVAGGMAANLVDRATRGRVTDYLATPLGVLNAADLAIGAGLVLGGIGLALR